MTVIIPSKTTSNVIQCVEAARRNEPGCFIGIVDDGVDRDLMPKHLVVAWVDGKKPFIYARNCNLGIEAAGGDDIILLNDDALLKTPRGFSAMAKAAQDHPEYGVIAATTNAAGNTNQYPRQRSHFSPALREDPRMVCFVCVYIPRTTIERVGLLDERFTGYGFEDDDYCLRVRQAGLKIGIFDGCFVDHASLKSSFRGDPRTAANLARGRQIFVEKWGAHPL